MTPVFVITPHDVAMGVILVLTLAAFGWLHLQNVLRTRRRKARERS